MSSGSPTQRRLCEGELMSNGWGGVIQWLGLPSFERHRELLAHDRERGAPKPLLGERFHWGRSWLIQKQRQWWATEALVAGNNPWLGALRAAGLARQGARVMWVYAEEPDPWDCALARRGMHAEALERAGLPGGGRALFEALAAQCEGRLTMAWDRKLSYRAGGIAFLERASARATPLAQGEMSGWLREAFRREPRIEGLKRSRRLGGGERDGIVFFERLAWVSDPQDGAPRETHESHCEAPAGPGAERWGSAHWSTGDASVFAKRSLADTRRALKLGGWM